MISSDIEHIIGFGLICRWGVPPTGQVWRETGFSKTGMGVCFAVLCLGWGQKCFDLAYEHPWHTHPITRIPDRIPFTQKSPCGVKMIDIPTCPSYSEVLPLLSCRAGPSWGLLKWSSEAAGWWWGDHLSLLTCLPCSHSLDWKKQCGGEEKAKLEHWRVGRAKSGTSLGKNGSVWRATLGIRRSWAGPASMEHLLRFWKARVGKLDYASSYLGGGEILSIIKSNIMDIMNIKTCQVEL